MWYNSHNYLRINITLTKASISTNFLIEIQNKEKVTYLKALVLLYEQSQGYT